MIRSLPARLLRTAAFAAFGLGVLAAGGCMTASQAQDIRRDVNQIKLDLGRMQSSQNESLRRIETILTELDKNVATDNKRLLTMTEDLSREVAQLRDNVGGASTSPAPSGYEPSAGSEEPVPASEENQLWTSAREEHNVGNYEDAIVHYLNYVKTYPESSRAPQAVYYLGQCYYEQEDYAQAEQVFDLIQTRYPDSAVVPHSLFSKAVSEVRQNKNDAARATIQTLRDQYPDYETERVDGLLQTIAP